MLWSLPLMSLCFQTSSQRRERKARSALPPENSPNQVRLWSQTKLRKHNGGDQSYTTQRSCVYGLMVCVDRWLAELWSEHPGGDPAEEGPEGQHEEGWLPHPECRYLSQRRKRKHPVIFSTGVERSKSRYRTAVCEIGSFQGVGYSTLHKSA